MVFTLPKHQLGRRNLALDGLRAFAIIPVMLAHFCITAHGPAWLQNVTSTGWCGVDLFFVLSGFLITNILLGSVGSEHYYRTFITRRALRIFPLYYALLAIMIVGARFRPEWGQLLHWGPGWFVFYLGNFRAAVVNKFPPLFSFGPLWSLQVEEQFYMLFPALVALTTLAGLRRVLIGLIAGAFAMRVILTIYSPGMGLACWVLPFCRMDALSWGAILAVLSKSGRLPNYAAFRWAALTGTALTTILFFTVSSDELNPMVRTIGFSIVDYTCVAFLGCIITQSKEGWTNRLLTFSPLVYIGQISYGLFLLHIPVSAAASSVLTRFFPDLNTGLPLILLSLTGAMAAATVSWFAFERPILALKDRWKYQRVQEAPTRQAGQAVAQ